MKEYKIYLFTFPNGKKYCGYTSQQNIHSRWHGGHGYDKCPLVGKAIKKYGWNNIVKEILFIFDDKEKALNKEKEIISLYNLTNPDYGYNLDEGGKPHGNANYLTEDGKKRISEANKCHWSNPEYREKMIKKFKSVPHSKLSDETKKKISETKKQQHITPPNAKTVIQLDLNEKILNYFKSASEASLYVINSVDGCSNILKVCQGKRKTAYGYKWRFRDSEK